MSNRREKNDVKMRIERERYNTQDSRSIKKEIGSVCKQKCLGSMSIS